MKFRSLGRFALIGLLAVAPAACGDEEELEDEPEIGQITLTIGPVSVRSVAEQPPSGTTTIPRGNHVVTVAARTAGGQAITLSPNDFELRISSSNNAVISYSKSNAFGGTMNAATAGSATLNIQLFHLGEGHPDYQVNVPVTVN